MLDSFIRFDDLLINRVFSPIAEWLFTNFSITNVTLSKYLCILLILFDLYDIYARIEILDYATAILDVIILTIFFGIYRRIAREQSNPPGTASRFRHYYIGRFFILTLSIITTCFMDSRVITTPLMVNGLILVYYFMACDTPKGDRLYGTIGDKAF